MVSMKDIADKLNISRTTVSNILNNKLNNNSYKKETIDAVKKTACKMNYVTNNNARSLKTGITNTIGIVVPDISNDYYINIIREVESLAAKKNYSLIVCITEESLEKEYNVLKTLESKRVDGVLIAPVSYEKSLKNLDLNFEILCFDRLVKNNQFNYVIINNKNSSNLLTHKLLNDKYKKPLFIAGSIEDYSVIQRLSGFKLALKEKNIKLDKERIIHNVFDDLSAEKKLDRIISKNNTEFDSIVLSTNYFIYGILESLSKNHMDRIPLGGFEDFKGSNLVNTPVYKVIQPEKEIAYKAFTNLIRLFNKKIVDNITLKTIITK